MTRYISSHRLFVPLLAFGVLASSAPAQAQAFEQGIVGGILQGIGLTPKSKPQIDYNDRPPLVLPPSADQLPPPGDPASAASNPAWPNDPDVAARRRAESRERVPAGTDRTSHLNSDNPLLSAEEIRGTGRVDTSGREFRHSVDPDGRTRMLTPDELRRGNTAIIEANKRPNLMERRSLTQPPVHYLEPSPNAPTVPVDAKGRPVDDERSLLQRLNPF